MTIDKISDIRLFVTVVEAGNFSTAARQQQISPSTASKTIERLERRLNARLFQRTTRSLGLTPEGRIFYAKCLSLLDAVEDAENATRPDVDITGRLRVQCAPAFGRYLLTPLIPEFLQRQPALHLELLLGLNPISPTEPNFDLMIQAGELSDSSLVAHRIVTVEWVICAAPSYLERHGTPREPHDLANHVCLTFSARHEWNVWQFMIEGKPAEQQVRGNLSSNDGGTLLDAARAGVGIARLGSHHVAADLHEHRLVPLLMRYQAPAQPIFAAHHNRRQLSPRIRVFIEFLLERFDQEARMPS
nr:LysR family transcriptional regulator [Pseudomonas sp.]